jgi:hypothetical protein
MRKAYFLLFLAPAAVVYCGGDNGTNLDGGSDAANDNTTGDSATDAAKDTGGDSASEGGNDAGQDVTISIACTKPSDCVDGGADGAVTSVNCCGTINTTGSFPTCSFASATTACEAPSACPTTFDTMGCGSDTVRLCTVNGDCTENTYNKCCSFKYQDASVHFCANQGIASIAGGTCP